MTLLETLQTDMGTSMKAGEATRTGVVRLLIAAMKNEAIKAGHPLSAEEELKVFQREAKQRRDSITQYLAASRQDLVDVEESELVIIQTYLPEALTDAELDAIVDEVIAATGATDMKQMGAVIGSVMKRVGARAEGGAVSAAVRSKLGAQ